MDRVLLETDEVLIRYCPSKSNDLLVITFANFRHRQSKILPGFGEALFRAEGISALHISCDSNNWYQYRELLHIGDLVASLRDRYKQVVTYGSSMGAYAAILFSGQIRADRVIAASPQYSINPTKVAFDNTWDWVAKDVAFINDEIASNTAGQIILIYDDKHVDGQHADRIADDIIVQRIAVPYAGHPVLHDLQQTGVLKSLILDLIRNGYDEERVRGVLRLRRRQSAGHLCGLARRGKSIDRRLRLLERARELDPKRIEAYAIRGHIHNQLGNLAAAAQAFQEALVANPNHHWSKIWLAETLSNMGQPETAIAIAKDAVAASPLTAEFHYTLGRCLTRAGDHFAPAAMAAFEEAIRLNPTNIRYQQSYKQGNSAALPSVELQVDSDVRVAANTV